MLRRKVADFLPKVYVARHINASATSDSTSACKDMRSAVMCVSINPSYQGLRTIRSGVATADTSYSRRITRTNAPGVWPHKHPDKVISGGKDDYDLYDLQPSRKPERKVEMTNNTYGIDMKTHIGKTHTGKLCRLILMPPITGEYSVYCSVS